MKISAISDVHVKFPGDEADKLLASFFHNPEVQNSDYIVLLGDIFDLMVGPHKAYYQLFKHHFEAMDELFKKGKKIFFIEGNHDVHLEKLFRDVWKNKDIVITQKPIVENINGKKYYFSHGDEHEIENHAYHRYIKFIRTKPLKFVADYIMPYAVLNFIGTRASKVSRKVGMKTFDADGVRKTFRHGVAETTKGEFDFVLGGHSHVKDEYVIPGTTSVYLNNGYALRSKTFILIDNHKVSFPSLV